MTDSETAPRPQPRPHPVPQADPEPQGATQAMPAAEPEPTTEPAPPDKPRRSMKDRLDVLQRFSMQSVIFTVLGLVVVLVGMYGPSWRRDFVREDQKFPDFRAVFEQMPGDDAWREAYFNYGARTLLIVAVAGALLAAFRSPFSKLLRTIAGLAAILGALFTAFAPALDDVDLLTNYLKTGLGMWIVVAGFVLIGIGAFRSDSG